jgi:hypothetical protein
MVRTLDTDEVSFLAQLREKERSKELEEEKAEAEAVAAFREAVTQSKETRRIEKQPKGGRKRRTLASLATKSLVGYKD